eukprot:CAMPEP_0172772788 /NCGR_PEP_ID=MMETSP1074-20121228/193019_1 /TAXON_ID=2916 /ORGANISM="Ceratium fusus, Strain PA161109" /LENGTH=70 /DNA_ID=CAMNT_0013608961 /DNA_START=206 /DNA_END=418 /DNA_ORIENTATION=-
MLKDAEHEVNSKPVGIGTSLSEPPISLQSKRSFTGEELGVTDAPGSNVEVTKAISKLRRMTTLLRTPAAA